jgi:lysophospholipase L1-like esterase
MARRGQHKTTKTRSGLFNGINGMRRVFNGAVPTGAALVLALLAVSLYGQSAEEELAAHVRLLTDWGGLVRYGSENAEIKPPKPGENRVVFLGDDVFENWEGDFFPGKPYLNRGIARQTSPQMLVRFRQDVISLRPAAVVIQAGFNDFAGFAGPSTEGMIAENLMTMVELARLHGIKVVLASTLPLNDTFGKIWTERTPTGKLIGLNGWMREYCTKNGHTFLDLYGPLSEARAFKKDWTVDGLRPNAAGYAAMKPLVEKAIAEALSRR